MGSERLAGIQGARRVQGVLDGTVHREDPLAELLPQAGSNTAMPFAVRRPSSTTEPSAITPMLKGKKPKSAVAFGLLFLLFGIAEMTFGPARFALRGR